jgi:hypothetical protein
MGAKVAEVALKALAGGLFVLAFAALAQTLTPKRFAGVFSAARAGGGPDAERPELVEREDAVGEALQDLLDAVEFDVAVGIGRLLPRLGALEGDPATNEQAP